MSFLDNLSTSLLRIIEKDNLSYEKLANRCELSTRFVTKVIHRKAAPTITSLEKICNTTDCTPNELLLFTDGTDSFYRTPMIIKTFITHNYGGRSDTYAYCPRCNAVIERDFQNFCSSCGQRLDWKNF